MVPILANSLVNPPPSSKIVKIFTTPQKEQVSIEGTQSFMDLFLLESWSSPLSFLSFTELVALVRVDRKTRLPLWAWMKLNVTVLDFSRSKFFTTRIPNARVHKFYTCATSPFWTRLLDFSNVKSLNMRGCKMISEEVVSAFLELDELETVDLSGCSQVTDKIGWGFKNHPNIRTLDLSLCTKLTDKVIKSVKRIPNLTSFSMGRCPALSEDVLPEFGEMPELRFLDLEGCFKSVRGISENWPDMPKLQTLNLGWGVPTSVMHEDSPLGRASCASLLQVMPELRNLVVQTGIMSITNGTLLENISLKRKAREESEDFQTRSYREMEEDRCYERWMDEEDNRCDLVIYRELDYND